MRGHSVQRRTATVERPLNPIKCEDVMGHLVGEALTSWSTTAWFAELVQFLEPCEQAWRCDLFVTHSGLERCVLSQRQWLITKADLLVSMGELHPAAVIV